MARISVLSAAEAGFRTTLFTDRLQTISHSNLQIADWREIDIPWGPEDVRLRGEDRPCYAAFSDLFRFALLSQHDGWWFDTDTIILRDSSCFAELLRPDMISIGRENGSLLNGAVLGSMNTSQAQSLLDAALPAFPTLDRWGIVGPGLITNMVASGDLEARIFDQSFFYPVHHNEIAKIYLPEERTKLISQEKDWYCLSLWGEVLSRSGLKYLAPPPGSYLADLLGRNPAWGSISGDPVGMANYLSKNMHSLEDLDSGRVALHTLIRKSRSRLTPRRRKAT
jgi:hypothetical protein